MTDAEERILELRQWMDSRITQCRREELKFGHRVGRKGGPQALVEAWTERRALQAVQKILGLPETPETEESERLSGGGF